MLPEITNNQVTTSKQSAHLITLLKSLASNINDNTSIALFIQEQANMTVQKSFDGKAIRVLESAGENIFDVLNALLSVTAKALNVKENLNNFQAMDIIQTLISDYKDVKIDEFVYIFKQGKKGIYGPHYNKLDIETIIGWINGYFNGDEYNNFLENRHKAPIEKEPLTEAQKQNWSTLLLAYNKFKEEHEAKKEKSKPVIVNQVPFEVLSKRLTQIIKTLSDVEIEYWLKEYTEQSNHDMIKLLNIEKLTRESH